MEPILATIKGGLPCWLGSSKEALYAAFKKYEGRVVRIEVDCDEPKTRNQLAYYFDVCVPLIRSAMIDAGHDIMGVPPTIDQVDYIIKNFCARIDGKQVICKRNMSKEKASRFITNVIQWAAVTLHVAIPEPRIEE